MCSINIYVLLLAACNVCMVLGALTKRSPADDLPIIYPGPKKDVDMNRYSLPGDDEVPEACRGQNFCTVKPKNYPEERYSQLFKDMRPSMPSVSVVEDDIEVVNKQGDPNDKDNCESIISFEPLYQVRDKREHKWRTVVQVPKSEFVQRVRLEKCINTDSPCFTVFPNIPGYTTHCKQKYSNWEVVVDNGKGGTETIVSELPMCCSCHYRSTDVDDRFGKPKHKA